MDWHRETIDTVLQQIASSRAGLSAEEAGRRLRDHGPNELAEQAHKTPFGMFLTQFTDFMILVLIVAAVVAGIVGSAMDAVPIIIIVLLNAIIGFVQEYRAARAIAALREMAGHTANLVRDGVSVTVATRDIVPGDLITLEAGDVVPADIRLLETARLNTVEAALTGESLPVEKQTEPLSGYDIQLGGRTCMAYKGTTVSCGRGMGIAVATGMATELGKIAAILQSPEEKKTPLQRRLAIFGQRLAIIILAICVVIFTLGFLRGEPLLLMLLTAISLAVAAIPEALPAVVTISLALGARKMVRHNALIRKLPVVETLGSVTYICSDKTGTLTLNRMTVEQLYVDGEFRPVVSSAATRIEQSSNNPYRLFMTALTLSNDARQDVEGELIGDPTETALYAACLALGFDRESLERDHHRITEIPFDSDRKCMTTIHQTPDGIVSFTKGAIEVVVERITTMMIGDGESAPDCAAIISASERMAADGLRVLAVALRCWDRQPEGLQSDQIERDLTFLGLVGMMDPPRDEAREAVAQCRLAGIMPVMITGDHPITARIIARRLAILEQDDDTVVTGKELAEMPLDVFEQRVEQIRVYARVVPEQKLKIVTALQDRGHFVAMTGDGINDAPALKRADIGIAMGITGTDVSKEASDIILLDDNFATIVKAVQEGRRIYANILKFITYSITSNAGTLVAITLAPFFGLPLPLLPIQILWLNLLCDSLPGLALAGERAERTVMQRPPMNPMEGIFSGGRGGYVAVFGFLIGFAALGFQAFALQQRLPWQTMLFTFLVMNRMAVALAVRSDRESLLQLGLFSNLPLIGAISVTFLLQMMVIYVPLFNPIFATESLSPLELALTLILALGMVLVSEVHKAIIRLRSAG